MLISVSISIGNPPTYVSCKSDCIWCRDDDDNDGFAKGCIKKDSEHCEEAMNKTSDLPEILKDDDLNSKPIIQLRPQEVSLKLVPNEDMKLDIDVMVCKPDEPDI